MNNSASKAEVMKPVLLKAGIPLAISVAGLFYARFMARRTLSPKASLSENQVNSFETNSHKVFRGEESFHNLNSTSSPCIDDEEQIITSDHIMSLIQSTQIQDIHAHEEEVLGLRTQIEEVQKRELELGMQFIRYRDLKEQESVLMELRNMLLETAYVEFLDREMSFMEVENKRLENLVIQYLRVLEQLECLRSENRLLQRKVKKLLRKSKDQSRVIREKNLRIEAREGELLRSHDELETRTNVIKNLENEVKELQTIADQLQEQKNELLSKLNFAEQSASSNSKIEDEGKMITMEEYKQIVNEYDSLQKDRAAEVKELIYLRWSNACLRHELMRSRVEQEYNNQEKKNHLDKEFEENGEYGIEQQLDSLVLEQGESCFGVTTGSSHACLKRRKLLQKFKRWMEGSGKMKSKLDEKERPEIKCFGRNSVSDGAEEEHMVLARKSSSSA